MSDAPDASIRPRPVDAPLVDEAVDLAGTRGVEAAVSQVMAEGDVDEHAAAWAAQARLLDIARHTAAEGTRRAARLGDDLAAEIGMDAQVRRPPPRLHYPRWGWRRAVEFAVARRMTTPDYLRLYRRFLVHRVSRALHGQDVVFQGMTFTGKRVEFHARPGHGRLVVGPWCWIGNDNKLRAHEGQLTLGAKVVMGRDNVVNTYLDIEIGDATILADWIYICDFDHRYDRLDLPIKDQGIVTSPVRVGEDVWIGEKATVLRGVDIGRGSVVASHCLVNKDIPPFSIAVGVPSRVVKSRLPEGMDPEEATSLLRRGLPIPNDPLG